MTQSIDMESMILFAKLSVKKKELSKEVEDIKSKMKKLSEELTTQMANCGLGSLFLEKYGTIKIDEKQYPKYIEGKGSEDLIAAMKLDGVGDDFIKPDYYNPKTFASYLTELVKNDEELPENLSKCITLSPVFTLKLLK